MKKLNKKGFLEEFMTEFLAAVAIVIIVIVFGLLFNFAGAFKVLPEVTLTLAETDAKIIHLVYLKTPYEDGTVSDELIRISMEEDERKQEERIAKLQEFNTEFIKPYPGMVINGRIQTKEDNILLKPVYSESREKEPTLLQKSSESTITLPTPKGDINVSIGLVNIYDIQIYKPSSGEINEH